MNELNLEETVENTTNDDSNFSLSTNPLNLPLTINSFENEKELSSFIRNVEKMIRFSSEYKLWVSYVTDSLGNRVCALTEETMTECSLVVHHHPITLYVIVQCVINDYMSKEQQFTTYDIAKTVMNLHYQNKVGYIVLLNDIHRKYHDGFQELPIDSTHGDYKYILNNYTIDETESERILELCKIKKKDILMSWSKNNYPGLKSTNDRKQLVETKEQIMLSGDIS